jgi:U32 family peptidase
MDSSTPRNTRPRLVAPAGNLEKLRFAVAYGADEVYFGGGMFNLRSQADNLGLEEIRIAADHCRERNVRTVFLLNSFLHERDTGPAREYIAEIAKIPIDALMVSDPGMLALVRDAGVKTAIHLSTQASTLNHLAVRFWEQAGVSRIVLARETGLDEIRSIRDHTDAELEIFVHGALCISYSGRCLLSRFLSGRDANSGTCAHPCRWRYALVEEKRQGAHMEIIEHARGTEILASKDLCLIERLPEYAAAGVDAFKIEGRMKSLYYTANTTRVYRHALETINSGGAYADFLPFWQGELDLVSHRPYTADLFNEYMHGPFSGLPYINRAMFVGCSADEGGSAGSSAIKAYNPIRTGDRIEAIFPIEGGAAADGAFTVKEIRDGEKSVVMAEPGRIYDIQFDRPLARNAVLRRRIN